MSTPTDPVGEIGAQLQALGWREVHQPQYIHSYFDKVDKRTTLVAPPLTPDKADPIGLGIQNDAFVRNDLEVETVTLTEDLYLKHDYDASKLLWYDGDPPLPEGTERSLCFWTEIDPADAVHVGTPQAKDPTGESAALLPHMGGPYAEIAVIPAGTVVSWARGAVAPQAEGDLKKAVRSGDLSSAYPNNVLESIGDVRLGGGQQIAFVQFDESWIRFAKDPTDPAPQANAEAPSEAPSRVVVDPAPWIAKFDDTDTAPVDDAEPDPSIAKFDQAEPDPWGADFDQPEPDPNGVVEPDTGPTLHGPG